MTPTNLPNPSKLLTQISRHVRLSDLDSRHLLLLLPALSLLLFFLYLSTTTTTTTTTTTIAASATANLNRLSYLPTPLKSLMNYTDHPSTPSPLPPSLKSLINYTDHPSTPSPPSAHTPPPSPPPMFNKTERKLELDRSRIAICLVGGARRFELTGPSIVQNILEVYPNADLFLNSPLDFDAYKFSLLKAAPKVATIRVFKPKPIPETGLHFRLLSPTGSPNGIQGLLQYFNLVEGCISMINYYQEWNNFTYDWVIRTRVDGYWTAPLDPDMFVPGHYLVPSGSSYAGLNDRFGVGDFNSSKVALSRLSLLPKLDSAGLHKLNSERAFKAQLTSFGVPFTSKRMPFCVMTDRKLRFPPGQFGEPIAAISSLGPLSGTKCRPCSQPCNGACVAEVMNVVAPNFGWTYWENGTLELCDSRVQLEKGWEELFDRVAGKTLAAARKQVSALKLEQCVSDFEEMKKRAYIWDAPTPAEICSRGLSSR